MSDSRAMLAPLAGLALMVFLAGCRDKSNPPRAEAPGGQADQGAGRSSGAPAPSSAPKRVLKAAKDLKVPEGLDGPVNEVKMRRSWWDAYQDARAGDLAEYDLPGTAMRTRSEVFDLADHAAMILSEVTLEAGGNPMKTRSASRMSFVEDEPDEAADTKAGKMTFIRKPASRKFKVGDREVTADTLNESHQGGKVVARSWQSKQMPSAVLQTEDGEGKVTMRLVNYRRGQ